MILTVDVGTTTLKAAIFSEDGSLVASSRQTLEIIDSCHAEPKHWISALEGAIRQIKAEKGFDSGLQAIIIDGNGPTLVTYPETQASLWLDRSAQEESTLVSAAAGHFIDSSFIIPKVLKLKRKNPDVYRRTRWFFGTQDYLNFILTGVPTTLMPLEGLEKWYWDAALLEKLELDASKFPPFIEMGQLVGTLTDSAALMLGLEAGVKVFAGCPDFVTSIIGTGAMQAGMTCDRSGTSEGINFCSSTASSDGRLMCYRHPNGKDYNISGIISTTGEAIGKVMELLGFEPGDFQGFYQLAAESSCTDVIFQPYLAGERAPIWDSNARGSFFGLTLDTSRADLARAVCEGICLAIYDVLRAMEGKVSELRVTGGPSQHDFLNQLKADICQVPVLTIDCTEPELEGLAVIALRALGKCSTLADGAEKFIRIRKKFIPDRSRAGYYQKKYIKYKALYSAVKGI